jgi:phosphatidylinositol alpha-mannosyltransferase
MWATLEARAPVVGTFHSGATRARLYDLTAPLIRRVARRLAVRIAVSERAAAFERSRIGGAFEIIPNGVETAAFAEATPADLGAGTKLLFVGRLDARKGFPDAVDALRRLAARRDDLRLVVAGDGPQRGEVDRLADGDRARVRMLGRVPHAELPAVAAACDLYLGPATGGESFGVVLVEAMAAGLPVVASDIPGYDEVVRSGVDGVLVPAGDPHELAAAVARVLDDDVLASRLAEAGRTRAREFDWAPVVERVESVYDEALERGPARLR